MQIILLEKDKNKLGDLFSKIIRDLFHALGYEAIKLNVHKTGREVDILGQHRLEQIRHFRAECKATKDLTGGDEINKFVGLLDAERRQIITKFGHQTAVTGFFVSLTGFKDSAVTQEAEFTPSRVILLDGVQVVDELVRGRIIVSKEAAIDHSSRCLPLHNSDLTFHSAKLLAHAVGLIWAIYYHSGKKTSHFCLVHADGVVLEPSIARQVISSARGTTARLAQHTYLSPVGRTPSSELVHRAKQAYLNYLKTECGEILLDGLPADEQVGSKKLRLENLFVPLHLVPPSPQSWEVPSDIVESAPVDNSLLGKKVESLVSPPGRSARGPSFGKRSNRTVKYGQKEIVPRRSLGEVLGTTNRIALLAAPGGGKSTLVKRLAVAYAFPDRRKESNDKLPDRNWLPLFVRCRDLGTTVRQPILQVLRSIAGRAEMNPECVETFEWVVQNELRDGKVLLLIDGLDEISDDGERTAFVGSLRTFLGTYGGVSIIITSREAGFRAVAGALGAECSRYRLADFSQQDVKQLVLAWHREVYGRTVSADKNAIELAAAIISDDRIFMLASNPMLLTTLLLVKRWVGQLPTKRTVLYDKAIEVLLMTWNVQAHAPISLDEALPRLEFVAFAMMVEGLQKISRPRLRSLLIKAREELPEVLSYSQLSDEEFIDRIELRSSLLIQAGVEVDSGRLVPLYEFRHLTFQEYLVAKAVVDDCYPNRKIDNNAINILRPFLQQQSWSQIVPLVAVLSGRKGKEIVDELAHSCESLPPTVEDNPRSQPPLCIVILAQCLSDEVQLAPSDLDKALIALIGAISNRKSFRQGAVIKLLLSLDSSKFGQAFRRLLYSRYENMGEDASELASFLGLLLAKDLGFSSDERLSIPQGLIKGIRERLQSDKAIDQASAASLLMHKAFLVYEATLGTKHLASIEELYELGDIVCPLLGSPHSFVQYPAAWALAWIGSLGWKPSRKPDVYLWLGNLFLYSDNYYVQRQVCWAILTIANVSRNDITLSEPPQKLIDAILRSDQMPHESWPVSSALAGITLAYYYRKPWSLEQMRERVERIKSPENRPSWEYSHFLRYLESE